MLLLEARVIFTAADLRSGCLAKDLATLANHWQLHKYHGMDWWFSTVMIGSMCRWHFSQWNESAACSVWLPMSRPLITESSFWRAPTWGFIALYSNAYLGQPSANKPERFFVSQLLISLMGKVTPANSTERRGEIHSFRLVGRDLVAGFDGFKTFHPRT